MAAHDLLAEMAWRADSDEPERMSELFASNGILDVGDRRICGRPEIADFLKTLKQPGVVTSHLVGSVVLEDARPGELRARSKVLMTRIYAGRISMTTGMYDDALISDGEGAWLLGCRTIMIVGHFRGS